MSFCPFHWFWPEQYVSCSPLRCSTSMPRSHQLMRRRLWTRPANTRTATTKPSAASRSILWSRPRCSQSHCNLVGWLLVSFIMYLLDLSLPDFPYGLLCEYCGLTDWRLSGGKTILCLFVCFLVVGAFHSQDQSGGHQQPPQQGPGFGRQGQSFYNSRGMSRGGPRNARGMINGYRGSSNGFRGKLPPIGNLWC